MVQDETLLGANSTCHLVGICLQRRTEAALRAGGLVFVAPSVSPALEPASWWRELLNPTPLCWLAPPAFRVYNQEIISLRSELEIMEKDGEDLTILVTVVQEEKDPLVPAGNADFIQDKIINGMKTKVVMLEGANHFILSGIGIIGFKNRRQGRFCNGFFDH
ncbi:MAG: hypothetical protein AAFO03_09660 [Bacteroidota bacterium]